METITNSLIFEKAYLKEQEVYNKKHIKVLN